MTQTAILLACAGLLIVALVLSVHRTLHAARHRNEPTNADVLHAIGQVRHSVSSLHKVWEDDRRERQTRAAAPVINPPKPAAKRKSAKAR